MGESYVIDGALSFGIQFLWYFLLTAHVCLFVDLSRFQKHPMSKLNHIIASAVSALPPLLFVRLISFPSALIKHSVGIGFAIVLSVIVSLFIQQIIKIDGDF